VLNKSDFPKDQGYLSSLLEDKISVFSEAPCKKGLLFGVEIENEAFGLDEPRLPAQIRAMFANGNWKIITDNSLRGNGYEFVSPPKKKKDITDFLQEGYETTKLVKWSNSRRTSVHIHTNVADLTVEQLLIFLSVYWIFEPLLFLTTDKVRKDNTFCVSGSVESRNILEQMLVEQNLLNNMPDEEEQKYASLNLYPLRRFGTVECRIFHSTFDPNEFNFWLSHLEALYNFSLKKQTLTDVKKLFMDLTPLQFSKTILGEELVKKYQSLCKKDDVDLDNLVRDGYMFSRPILSLGSVLKDLRADFFTIKEAGRVKAQEAQEFARKHAIDDNWLDQEIIQARNAELIRREIQAAQIIDVRQQ